MCIRLSLLAAVTLDGHGHGLPKGAGGDSGRLEGAVVLPAAVAHVVQTGIPLLGVPEQRPDLLLRLALRLGHEEEHEHRA